MKKGLLIFGCALALTSCENTWDGESKDAYTQTCMEDARTWAGSEEKSKVYCDCMLNKIMTKYPKIGDALENMQAIIDDPEMQKCKGELTK